ncbi:cytochrome-c peroxidase [Photobacterium aquimaris]|uniref:Cytochrome c551 peroxidase n=1 Tax=Photobacterium aquimaris TaxID=512643 RepID=A0A1Y6KX25_9GAMM|nr:cytochrome c peroxidase [Photobacterium aquimaris]SMY15637.1 Cytochrome c551 peroxidase precursor [Photobacterium aquimaris]
MTVTYRTIAVLFFTPLVALTSTLYAATIPQNEKRDAAKVTLGKYLFNDNRLSKTGNRSCALCHAPDLGWTNRFAKVPDINNNSTTLNTPSLLNSVQLTAFMQRQPNLTTLTDTIKLPLFSLHPPEMGMTDTLLLKRLQQANTLYQPLFEASFGDSTITTARVISALSRYVATIIDTDTAYHAFIKGDKTALNSQQQQGLTLFRSQRLGCSQCHAGSLLNQPSATTNLYYNTGLYGIKNTGEEYGYPADETGLRQFTLQKIDDGKFRIPSLINVNNTGPWGHDGSFHRLEAVLDSYAAGGRIITVGPNKGDGRKHLSKDPRLQGFRLTPDEKQALIAFFASLSTRDMSKDPAHQSPFCQIIPLKTKQDPPNCITAFQLQQ